MESRPFPVCIFLGTIEKVLKIVIFYKQLVFKIFLTLYRFVFSVRKVPTGLGILVRYSQVSAKIVRYSEVHYIENI